jgi:hypothetical protein
VLAIVLVVLDKAGKLKGGWLYGLLAVAGLMTLFIAIGNSWVTDAPERWKIWRGGLLFCVVILAYSGLAIWISEGHGEQKEEETKASPSTPPTSAMPDEIKITRTLRELYDHDFSNLGGRWEDEPYTDKQTGEKVVFTKRLYLDPEHKEKFISFYIPASGANSRATSDVCMYLATHYQIALELEQTFLGVSSGNEVVSPEEMTFNGRVYIYHEDLLIVEDRATVVKEFRTHGASVVLRGPAYLIGKEALKQPSK